MNWQDHWKNMPEYNQEDKKAIKRVTLNFETIEDLEYFNKVTGLNVTLKTKGIFFPIKKNDKIVYESEVPNLHNVEGEMGK